MGLCLGRIGTIQAQRLGIFTAQGFEFTLIPNGVMISRDSTYVDYVEKVTKGLPLFERSVCNKLD